MLQNKVTILSTRPLEQTLINKAAEKNIFIEQISFIETEPVINPELRKNIVKLLLQQQTVVFTSMNAVETVASHLGDAKPNWKIFCIGSTTKNRVKEYFGESSIAGTADSAGTLADAIIKQQNISSVVFFCGDKRRGELPEKLALCNIKVNEVVVYRTIASSHHIRAIYDAIIFFSPSAVHSFFSSNTINDKTILFAIGNTTADEIKKYAGNKIIIAADPSKELLVEQALNYFEANSIHH